MLCSKSLSADNPPSPRGQGGALKFKKVILSVIVIIAILSVSCFSVSASASAFVDLFDLTMVVFGPESIMDYSVNKFSNSINVSVANNGFSGYQDLSFYFDFGHTVATPDNPLSFSFNLRHGDDQMGFLNTSWDGYGLYGFYNGELYKCGTATVINDTLCVSVDLTSEINYEYYRLSIYCYLNPCDTYYFNFEDCEFEYYSKIIANQDKNTDKEIQADKENTQAIIDNQNELVEKEKNEINSSGNDSVNGAMEVMPNYDLGDVFDGFINVMHYDGLDCILKIPEIYIPSVGGFFPKTVLYSGGEVNFKDYFDMIPSDILMVVRASLTVALILYSFKELWADIGAVLSGDGIKIMREGTRESDGD